MHQELRPIQIVYHHDQDQGQDHAKSSNDAVISDNDESDDVLQSREKMLELALPSLSSKRTQNIQVYMLAIYVINVLLDLII